MALLSPDFMLYASLSSLQPKKKNVPICRARWRGAVTRRCRAPAAPDNPRLLPAAASRWLEGAP